MKGRQVEWNNGCGNSAAEERRGREVLIPHQEVRVGAAAEGLRRGQGVRNDGHKISSFPFDPVLGAGGSRQPSA